jgi:hypothetical protein
MEMQRLQGASGPFCLLRLCAVRCFRAYYSYLPLGALSNGNYSVAYHQCFEIRKCMC